MEVEQIYILKDPTSSRGESIKIRTEKLDLATKKLLVTLDNISPGRETGWLILGTGKEVEPAKLYYTWWDLSIFTSLQGNRPKIHLAWEITKDMFTWIFTHSRFTSWFCFCSRIPHFSPWHRGRTHGHSSAFSPNRCGLSLLGVVDGSPQRRMSSSETWGHFRNITCPLLASLSLSPELCTTRNPRTSQADTLKPYTLKTKSESFWNRVLRSVVWPDVWTENQKGWVLVLILSVTVANPWASNLTSLGFHLLSSKMKRINTRPAMLRVVRR